MRRSVGRARQRVGRTWLDCAGVTSDRWARHAMGVRSSGAKGLARPWHEGRQPLERGACVLQAEGHAHAADGGVDALADSR